MNSPRPPIADQSLPILLYCLVVLVLAGCGQAPPPVVVVQTVGPDWPAQVRAVREGRSAEIDQINAAIGDKEIEELDGLTGLQYLILGDTTITNAGATRLASLTNLEQLRIAGSQIGDRGLEQLAGLPKLEMLRLGSPRVTDAAMAAVGKMPQLRFLILRTPQVTDAGLDQLGGLKQLESLYIEGTSVTDAGVARLHARLPELHIHW